MVVNHHDAGASGQYSQQKSYRDTLRFITCGSVDDGKSTLIGRLLFEAKMVFDDHLASLRSESKRFGTQGGDLDFALLVDGLAAEREQGITIDVAYRYFTTERRRFIVADTPGHEQYTRNMATGASTASLAIIIVDARKGILDQTRRHAFIASLLGIRKLVLAINKMDLVDYDRETFEKIRDEFLTLNDKLGFTSIAPIPMSALVGDNVFTSSAKMSWYNGPTLLHHLENVSIDHFEAGPLRLPVQFAIRPNQDFRGYAGRIAGGDLRCGDRVKILPSNKVTAIEKIFVGMDEKISTTAGQSVTFTVKDEFDISRGDMIVSVDKPPIVADQFRATFIWMQEEEIPIELLEQYSCNIFSPALRS